MKNLMLTFPTVLVLTLSACAPQVDTEAERAAIRTFHDECLSAQITGDVECFAEDGQMLPNEFPPIKGKGAIAEIVAQIIEDPNFAVAHDIIDIDVSHSGDLAYIHYAYNFTMSDPEGNPATERGNAIYILKRQPHIGWRYLLDLSNRVAEDVRDIEKEAVDHEAEAQALMELSREWSRVASSGDFEALLDFWSDDAVVLIPKHPVIEGKRAIRAHIAAGADGSGPSYTWEPLSAHISDNGDMAYLIERNIEELIDSDGNKAVTHNKVVTIWRKNSQGRWKNVVEIWNETPAPAD